MSNKVIVGMLVLFVVAGAVLFTKSSDTNPSSTPTPTAAANKGGEQNVKQPPEMRIDLKKTYTAVLKTNKGDITVALYTKDAPRTVNNFVSLTQQKLYDNTIFHRVIKDFMLQGGDPDGNGTGGPGYTFKDEISSKRKFDKPGLLAMANRGPNTNGSQFFITVTQTPWLDGKHTIFGEVVKGMDVVFDIENVKTGPQDKPIEDVIVKTIEIVEK